MAIDAPKKGRRSPKAQSGATPDEPKSAITDSQADPDKNWASEPDSPAYSAAKALYKVVRAGYQNKEEQEDRLFEFRNMFAAIPDENQQYSGNSNAYVPVVRDCTNARAKRALAQLFPDNGRHVDGLGSDDEIPYTPLSLLEYYVRKTRLKSIVRTDLICGDITGQWNLMLDWTKSKRTITKAVRKNAMLSTIDGENVEDMGIEDPTEEVEVKEEETITEEGPEVTDFATEDLVVIPPTCQNLQKAQAVALRLYMSVENVREMEDEGVFILPKGTEIEAFCNDEDTSLRRNQKKKAVFDAGIKTDGTNKFALVYMVYTKLDFGGERKESGIIYYAGEDEIVGIIKNPLWSGRVPMISEPVERMQGSFFGRSEYEPVKYMQWAVTDFLNMSQDAAMYSVMPIYKVDPLKVPQWTHLVQGLAAIWPVAPGDVEAMVTPALWKDAAAVCDFLEQRIWQSMDVNEMMMGRMPSGRKNNAMIGGMQQEATVNISDHATRYEDVMLNPLVEMLFEFDQQFRTADLMIEQRGEIGVKAKMETIPPMQWGTKYAFYWLGTQVMLGMQRMQNQIALMNVLKGIPPQQLGGRTLDVSPILVAAVENVFGPDMAPKILVDKTNQFTISPEIENEVLHNGFTTSVHEADNDPEHLQSHMRAAATNQDPLGLYKMHMGFHMAQLQRKQQMQMAAAGGMVGGAPGSPGGGPGSIVPPGAAGTPRPGAVPSGPRGIMQQPPGAISPDAMADPSVAGRG